MEEYAQQCKNQPTSANSMPAPMMDTQAQAEQNGNESDEDSILTTFAHQWKACTGKKSAETW